MRYDGVCDINNYSGCGDYDRYWILSHAMAIAFMDKMMVATIVTLISDKVAFFVMVATVIWRWINWNNNKKNSSYISSN
jgi:hypothetical protein